MTTCVLQNSIPISIHSRINAGMRIRIVVLLAFMLGLLSVLAFVFRVRTRARVRIHVRVGMGLIANVLGTNHVETQEGQHVMDVFGRTRSSRPCWGIL